MREMGMRSMSMGDIRMIWSEHEGEKMKRVQHKCLMIYSILL